MTARFMWTTFAAMMGLLRDRELVKDFHAMQSRACRSERFGPGWSE